MWRERCLFTRGEYILTYTGEICGYGKAGWDGAWLNEIKCSPLFKGEKKLKLPEANVGKKTL